MLLLHVSFSVGCFCCTSKPKPKPKPPRLTVVFATCLLRTMYVDIIDIIVPPSCLALTALLASSYRFVCSLVRAFVPVFLVLYRNVLPRVLGLTGDAAQGSGGRKRGSGSGSDRAEGLSGGFLPPPSGAQEKAKANKKVGARADESSSSCSLQGNLEVQPLPPPPLPTR